MAEQRREERRPHKPGPQAEQAEQTVRTGAPPVGRMTPELAAAFDLLPSEDQLVLRRVFRNFDRGRDALEGVNPASLDRASANFLSAQRAVSVRGFASQVISPRRVLPLAAGAGTLALTKSPFLAGVAASGTRQTVDALLGERPAPGVVESAARQVGAGASVAGAGAIGRRFLAATAPAHIAGAQLGARSGVTDEVSAQIEWLRALREAERGFSLVERAVRASRFQRKRSR